MFGLGLVFCVRVIFRVRVGVSVVLWSELWLGWGLGCKYVWGYGYGYG